MKSKIQAVLTNPLRDIPLNRDELIHHAVEIARFHAHVGTSKKNRGLMNQVRTNMNYLQTAHSEIVDYVQRTKDIVPAAEWFLDNYYVLKDLKLDIKKNLPRRYERELPCLVSGEYQGYPRVYALMVELVEHTDSHINGEILKEFIEAYQSEVPLSSGELWAIPLMLRIVLLENIKRLVSQVIYTQREREGAEEWLTPLISTERSPEQFEELLNSQEKPAVYSSAYAERLLKRLRELGVDASPILHWFDKVLSKQDATIEGLSKLEHQRQAMCQVSMGHSIASMRFLAAEDWPVFFEEISLVQKILEKDPSGIYAQMDFDSRDKYRHQVEKIARKFKVSELVVARKLLERAETAAQSKGLPQSHVGFDLVGSGREDFEADLEKDWGRIRQTWCQVRRWFRRQPNSVYFGSITVISFFIIYLFTAYTDRFWDLNLGRTILVISIMLIPSTAIAIPLVNWLITRILNPTFFPKLELRSGIPDDLKTIVVIPTLLSSVSRVQDLVDQLEVYFLANQDHNLHFALLGDFTDSKEEFVQADEEIIAAARLGIERLNQKYGSSAFFLFHRKRLWNQAEGVWMGWERKRGKLIEFNRLLCQDGETTYTIQAGDLSVIPGIKYVITLDADTQLPRGVAKKLIGTLAHPLHVAELNESGTRVVKGYGVLQPRIGVSVLSAGASFFSSIFSGKAGIDPYTTAVSDLYQDLFGEGIFTGKGIYDVRVFHKVTGNAFPENTILSHDLIEGLYARTGLVTDIELIDGYPAKYHAYMRRLHRWTRGDWQVIPWLLKPLPFISRWKIIDNLRRSLEALSLVLLIILAFTVLPGEPWVWVSMVLLTVLWPSILCLFSRIFDEKATETSLTEELKNSLIQALFQFSTLAYQAYIQLDAIVRSLVRQYFSHRRLLEWETAEDAERRLGLNLNTFIRLMWPALGVVILVTMAIYLSPLKSEGVVKFLPIALTWGASPWIAFKFSQPLLTEQERLSPNEQKELRQWSRRIWAFFEEYVNQEENWLPPDNIQIDPPNGIAHRTSPTNIGLAMLANLSARDFGYLSVSQVFKRVEATLKTLEGLERWNGHLYNWYDNLSLKPLNPLYVSTVDSGNLVIYMLTLGTGLKELPKEAIIDRQLLYGLKDTYDLMLEHFTDQVPDNLLALGAELDELIKKDLGIVEWYSFLNKWADERISFELPKEPAYWSQSLAKMLTSFKAEIDTFYLWLLELKQEAGDSLAPELSAILDQNYSITELHDNYSSFLHLVPASFGEKAKASLEKLNDLLVSSQKLQQRLRAMALATDFRPLYSQERQLFSIGYRVIDRTLDKSYYDLIASEARQASFIAIAKGDIPQSHWFRLGRSLTKVKGRRSLVSWSGTMFEFMMPLLIMKNYKGTILDETYRSVIEIQRLYGEERGIPWGISESGYYAFDTQLNYQYKAFGVPGLGLKRGLIQDLVIAPYSTFLALMIAPQESLKNLKLMQTQGFSDRYGLFEAIDYTEERIPLKSQYKIIKSYMAHHQGMSFLALANLLFGNRIQELFHSDALVQATELLLQERVPAVRTIIPQPEEKILIPERKDLEVVEEDRFVSIGTADSLIPITHFVSNGEYSVMITNAGSGFSRLGRMAVSRWREDVTKDDWGMYFYIQNLNSGDFWSATHQPVGYSGEDYKATYAPDRIEFYRKDGNIATKTEIVVSPEDPVEIRRLSLTNHSQYDRTLEVTSYFEVVLARPNEDLAHPAFGNLFIQTEFTHQALLASRRPRRDDQTRTWLMHTVALEGEGLGGVQYETDRARFIGRGRSLSRPQALELNQPLSNTVGAVLDPVMSLRQRVVIKPGQTVRLSFSTGVTDNRDVIIRLADKYRDPATVNRAFELAWTHSQMELRHLGLTPAQANESLSLGGQLLYLSPGRLEAANILERNSKGQSSLWPYSISGDLPIALVRVKETQHLDLVKQLLTVHEYWRFKGLFIDLVILNEDESGYVQAFQDLLRELVSMGHARDLVNKPGGIFLLQSSHVAPDDLVLIQSVSRVIFLGEDGSCTVQVRKKGKVVSKTKANHKERYHKHKAESTFNKSEQSCEYSNEIQCKVQFDNGYGGFSQDGKEYIIHLRDHLTTPLPWLNVIANPKFGFQITESGGGYTWSQNSRENKLTPWSNDPVVDPPGEVIYIKDEDCKYFWTPTPSPIRENESYTVRHGQGYTIFSHRSNEIDQELLLFAPMADPVKVVRLTLKNLSGRERQLSLVYYAEWVMGVARELTAPYLVTEYNQDHQTIIAQNTFQEEFANRRVFLSGFGADLVSYTGDRTEFIGRNGSLETPRGLLEDKLSNSIGAGYDPCTAIQLRTTLAPGEERTICFYLGEAESYETALTLVKKYKDFDLVQRAFEEVLSFWNKLLGTIEVETPDKSMDLLMNRWLLYQTTVCRIWARSAFYQSGGAYGFRDQLQDVMALVIAAPSYAREQILRHCAHQFVEGDVQHWWHPERDKGIRTKFSDDLLWLPYVTAHYLKYTEDFSILAEEVQFLTDEPLPEEEDERYSIPKVSAEKGTVYEHCIRAIERGLKFGEHGLPLIGSGDWNDGFSRIGVKGKGESVWLGWFLIVTLKSFADICDLRRDYERGLKYRRIVQELNENLERYAWDGGWYRRAYFDDGTPLGSARNEECQIDALAQSWSVISGGAKPSRAKDAMMALENYLLRKEDGILLLLTPPFNKSRPDPGYIKGYVPGVRENGGQYTHGAIWSILAYAKMGEGDKAAELFHLLNPINHARTDTEVARYKAEPYVMAADVYAIPPHVGRGGWTWYTGAAGWMYQAGLLGILGFALEESKLFLNPCIPKYWESYKIKYRYHSTLYEIEVENPNGGMTGVSKVMLDNQEVSGFPIDLTDDGGRHVIRVTLQSGEKAFQAAR